jgi:hypothetical protein
LDITYASLLKVDLATSNFRLPGRQQYHVTSMEKAGFARNFSFGIHCGVLFRGISTN